MKDDFWVEESSAEPSAVRKRTRRIKKRRLEFLGWGSRPLIEFLEAIGQDTTKQHSRHDVATFIAKYINDRGLASAEKKKKVLCDEILYAVFGKKSLSRIKVFDMLEEHFAENHDDSDSELHNSSEEENYTANNSTIRMKKLLKTPRSCFAAVIPENIKLVYLRKSLIQDLLKVPESFESKIVGSFVRMKSDPNDIYQKNRFQLQQVTGVEKVSGEFHLRVSNFFNDVTIDMLSDDNFSEEEIEDLQNRIKTGLLRRLTVNELEMKVQALHADITKHWIAKELSLLQKLIDRANEKGWRRELFEHLERRKLLQTPSEQEKLLGKMPEVIAEEVEPEGTVAIASEKIEVDYCSPKSILRGSSDVSSTEASGTGEIIAPTQVVSPDSDAPREQNRGVIGIAYPKNQNGNQQDLTIPHLIHNESSSATRFVISDVTNPPQPKPEKPAVASTEVMDVIISDVTNPQPKPEKPAVASTEVIDVIISDVKNVQQKPDKPAVASIEVIDLADDESEDEDKGNTGPDDAVWHYLDPQGYVRGPFSLWSLKRWSDSNYFHPGFMVWKTGQTARDSILLAHLLSKTFPC